MTVNINFEIISEKHITTNIDIIEEILDMPTEGEVQMNLTNIDCVRQDELCKVESSNNFKTLKQEII